MLGKFKLACVLRGAYLEPGKDDEHEDASPDHHAGHAEGKAPEVKGLALLQGSHHSQSSAVSASFTLRPR